MGFPGRFRHPSFRRFPFAREAKNRHQQHNYQVQIVPSVVTVVRSNGQSNTDVRCQLFFFGLAIAIASGQRILIPRATEKIYRAEFYIVARVNRFLS
jgi:hypothetical protein